MKLSAYLDMANMSDEAFAEKCRQTGLLPKKRKLDRSTIYRLRLTDQIPSKEVMQAIVQATQGAVTANDFYGIAA